MPYDSDRIPGSLGSMTFGANATLITPGPDDQLDANGKYYLYFVATEAGQVTFISYRGDDATPITMNVPAGFIIPGRVRRITSSTVPIVAWSS